ncbi:MAG: helix-turn-helix domain-containing protein [Mycobacteriales bacterium]
MTAADVGRLVRAARTRRAMTQTDLAAAAGVSRRWLVDLEAGKPRAELELALTVLAVLGVGLYTEAPDVRHSSVAPSTPGSEVDLDEHLAALMRTD